MESKYLMNYQWNIILNWDDINYCTLWFKSHIIFEYKCNGWNYRGDMNIDLINQLKNNIKRLVSNLEQNSQCNIQLK